MNVNPTQRAQIITSALARGAAAMRARGTGTAIGPTMNGTQDQRPEGPPGCGITAGNADFVAAEARDLCAWIAQQKRNGPQAGARPRPGAPVAARATMTRAPRTDADKAAAIAATWATLRARQGAAK